MSFVTVKNNEKRKMHFLKLLFTNEKTKFIFSGLEAFKNISNGFIKLIDSLAKEVDREKIMAIGARNLVKSMAKQRDAQEQQLQVLKTQILHL